MTTVLCQDSKIWGTWKSRKFTAKYGGTLHLSAREFSGCNPSLWVNGIVAMSDGTLQLYMPFKPARKPQSIAVSVNGTSAGVTISVSIERNRKPR